MEIILALTPFQTGKCVKNFIDPLPQKQKLLKYLLDPTLINKIR